MCIFHYLKVKTASVGRGFWIFLVVFFILIHKSIGQYFPAKVYSTEDGIPSHSVFDIAQTPDKLMWFLSMKGVFNYNSVDWKHMPDSLGLPNTAFSKMVTHHDGSLWVAGQNNIDFTVKYLLNGEWHTVKLPSEISRIKAGFSFNVFSEHDVYHVLLGAKGVLYDINVNSETVSIVKDEYQVTHINTIYVNAEEVMVSTTLGVFEYQNGQLVSSEINSHLSEGTEVLSVLSKNDALYLLGIGWLAKWQEERLTYLSTETPIKSGNLHNKHSLAVDSQGRLYFSSASVPSFYDPVNQTINELRIKQVDYYFLSSKMFIDWEENVWAGDYRGLFKYDMSSFQNYNRNTGLSQNEVSAIAEFQNEIVVANPQSLNFIRNGEIIRQTKLPNDWGARILDMQKLGNRLYLAGRHGGLYKYEDGSIQSLHHLHSPGIVITSLEVFKGELYISASNGLYRLDEGKLNKLINVNALRNLKTVGEDSLMILTERAGVLLYHKGDTTRYTSEKYKFNDAYTAMKWNDDILLGTLNGVARLSEGEIASSPIATSLREAGVYAFLNEGDKYLWIGSSEGIHKWDGENLITYNQQKGLLGIEVNRNAFMLDAARNLWVGTESGVSLFPRNNRGTLKVNEEILELIGKSKNQRITIDNSPKLAHDDNNVTFEFVWPTFRSDQSTTYRYKLKGSGEEWTDEIRENKLTFSKLSSGPYQFDIQAHLSGLKWSEVYSLNFKVKKPFYSTSWFLITAVFSTIIALYAIYRIRFYYLLKRQTILKRLVEKRTKNLAEKNQEIIQINSKLQETITDLKHTQKALVHTEKMASLGTMSAGIGHEINNPLNFIKGGVRLLLDRLAPNGDDSKSTDISKALKVIEDGVYRVSNIVTSLSEFSKTSTPNALCNVHEAIDNCLVLLRGYLSADVDVIKSYSNNKLVIKANVGNFHQAILNILSNASQAIQKTGAIEVTTQSLGDQLEIKICDNGVGIDPENAKKVFDPFFTTKEPGEGTGLGLSIAYNIIKEHEGTITFNSTLNKGTCVTIQLPKVDEGNR